jgi:RNA polymerase sigma factor (sigma-70 family)
MATPALSMTAEDEPAGRVSASVARLPRIRASGIGRVSEGLAPSFGDFYLGAYAEMVRLARVLVNSPEAAEDLVQDAFVHLHRHWRRVRDPRAYLRRSVVNACRSHHRRAGRERPYASRETSAAVTGVCTDDPVEDVSEHARAEDADVLASGLATLPYRQRAALVLRFYADLPDAEIAVALGCRPGTVASLVHRALQHLREVIDHE